MKIYARQIEPEFQDSRIFDDDTYSTEYINICGNKDYQSRTSSVFDRVKECLDAGELATEFEYIAKKSMYASYDTVTEAINNWLYHDGGKTYNKQQIGKLKRLVLEYSECSSSREDQILVEVLSIVTGEEWDYKQIHGCCQGEWNTVYYPIQYWTKESLESFEVMYFNNGSEWIVHDGDTEPTNPEEIDGCAYYCVSWNDEGIKKELAEAVGVENPEDIILYKYAGSVSVPIYKIA